MIWALPYAAIYFALVYFMVPRWAEDRGDAHLFASVLIIWPLSLPVFLLSLFAEWAYDRRKGKC